MRTRMNMLEIHQVVEHVRSVGADFDAADLSDLDDVEAVLWRYGYFESWDDGDLENIRQELLHLAEENQLAEIVRLIDEDEALSGLGTIRAAAEKPQQRPFVVLEDT